MTNQRFDLGLFSEGGAESAPEGSEDGAVRTAGEGESLSGNVGESESGAAEVISSGPPSRDCDEAPSPPADDFGKLCAALGLEGITADELISHLDSRREKQMLRSLLRETAAEAEYEKLISEAAALASKLGGFDIRAEMRDRRFSSLIRAGFPVEDAWRAAHLDELLSAAREEARESFESRALGHYREMSSRPDENGSTGHAPVDTSADVRSLTGRGIRDILRRVEKGAKVKF